MVQVKTVSLPPIDHQVIEDVRRASVRYLDALVILHTLGLTNPAIEAQRRALRLDPVSGGQHRLLGVILLAGSRYDEARGALDRAEALGSPTAYARNQIAWELGDIEGMRAEVEGPAWRWGTQIDRLDAHRMLLARYAGDVAGFERLKPIVRKQLSKYQLYDRWVVADMDNDLDTLIEVIEQGVRDGEPVGIANAIHFRWEMYPYPELGPSVADILARYGLDPASRKALVVPPFPAGSH